MRNDAGKSEEDLQEAGPDPGEGVQVQEESGPGEGVQAQEEAGPDPGEGVPAQDVHMRFQEEALKVLKHAGMPSPCQGSVSLAHAIAG